MPTGQWGLTDGLARDPLLSRRLNETEETKEECVSIVGKKRAGGGVDFLIKITRCLGL